MQKLYAIKLPVRRRKHGGDHIHVADERPDPDLLPKGAEVKEISDADRRKGAAHLLALFDA